MSWSAAKANIAESLPTFEPRPEQDVLATAIEDSLNAGEVIFAQGGCGVGKSFAGLIPAIDYSLDVGGPVVVSTATKSLQTQYIRVDVPFLKENLGRDFSAAVLKGRGNYACHAKLAELKPGAIQNLVTLRTELTQEEHTGDLDDIQTPILPTERPRITSGSDECPGKRNCPFGDVCFAEKAKQRAAGSDLIIVNHAALVSDLKIKEQGGFGILPEFAAVLIDESHELNSYATNALGAEFTQRGIQNLGGEVSNLLGAAAQSQVGALHSSTEALFDYLGGLLDRNERTATLTDQHLLGAEHHLAPFLQALLSIKDVVKGFAVHGDDGGANRQKRVTKRVNSLLDKFQQIIMASSDELVRWVERDDKRGVVLKFAPLHVGPFLHKMLWSRMPAVLMSATLAIGSDFSFVAEQHGVERYRQVDAGTPFDFQKQATMLVPSGCDPGSDQSGWKMKVQITASELIKSAGGRTLLLFSSRSAMKATHAALVDSLENYGLTVLIQGEGNHRALAERFKSDETSVLFGLKSFATGFDVQGDSLRLVIIDKMPFPVPSDVIFKARADAIAKETGDKWASFNRLSVPMMALDLLQAAGRLIRTKQDEGMIVIMDSRLLTKGYGKKIMNALPPARRVHDLPEAKGYLEELSARRG